MNPDFRDMLSALSGEGAEYLLVGACAVAVHGVPRATADLDIGVRPTTENARRVRAALTGCGAPGCDLSECDLVTPETVFEVGVAPNRIDVMASIDGLTFDDAWASRRIVRIAGHRRAG